MALHIQSMKAVRSDVVASAIATALLAHEGGWDEVLLVVGPILAIVGLLLLAKKRVDAAAGERVDAGVPDSSSTG
jgi:hypothetical protein